MNETTSSEEESKFGSTSESGDGGNKKHRGSFIRALTEVTTSTATISETIMTTGTAPMTKTYREYFVISILQQQEDEYVDTVWEERRTRQLSTAALTVLCLFVFRKS